MATTTEASTYALYLVQHLLDALQTKPGALSRADAERELIDYLAECERQRDEDKERLDAVEVYEWTVTCTGYADGAWEIRTAQGIASADDPRAVIDWAIMLRDARPR